MRRSLARAIAILLLVTPSLALAKPRVAARPPSPEKALCALGYCPVVAKKIALSVPALAASIIAAKSRPLSLFRGCDVDRALFKTDFRSTDPIDKLCFTDSPTFAIGYAAAWSDKRLRRGAKDSVMIDAQIPAMLLVNPKSELVFHMDQTRQLDIAPFIRRLGVLSLRDVKYKPDGDLIEQATLNKVRWTAAK